MKEGSSFIRRSVSASRSCAQGQEAAMGGAPFIPLSPLWETQRGKKKDSTEKEKVILLVKEGSSFIHHSVSASRSCAQEQEAAMGVRRLYR